MNIFLVTFQAVAALLGIGVLGYWVIGRRRVPANVLGLLTTLAIDIALPCLVLGSMLTQFSPDEFPDWWRMPVWWVIFTIIAVALSVATSFLIRKDFRGEFAMSLAFQNGAFFPILDHYRLIWCFSLNLLVYCFVYLFKRPLSSVPYPFF